jgi:hypothetical protein
VFACLNEDRCRFPRTETAVVIKPEGDVKVMDMISTIQLMDFSPLNASSAAGDKVGSYAISSVVTGKLGVGADAYAELMAAEPAPIPAIKTPFTGGVLPLKRSVTNKGTLMAQCKRDWNIDWNILQRSTSHALMCSLEACMDRQQQPSHSPDLGQGDAVLCSRQGAVGV